MATLSIRRGDEFTAELTFKNADNSAINLTGYTVSAAITWADGACSVTVEDVDRAAGRMRARIVESQTALIPPGRSSMLKITYVSAAGETKSDSCFVEGVG